MIFSDAGKVEGGEEGRNFTRQQLFNPVLQRLKAEARPGAPQQTIRVTGPVRYPGEYPVPASKQVADAIVNSNVHFALKTFKFHGYTGLTMSIEQKRIKKHENIAKLLTRLNIEVTVNACPNRKRSEISVNLLSKIIPC